MVRRWHWTSMVGIARQTDYAARIILHLASLPEGSQESLAAIAARRLLPLPFIRRIVAKLVGAGLVTTVRGARGGIRLALPAAEISLLDVVRAMEGEVVLNRCVADPPSCPLSSHCPVQREWTRLTRQLEAGLAAVRFASLARRLERSEGPRPRRRGRRATSGGAGGSPGI